MTYCDPNAIFCWPILFMTIRSATGPSKLSLTGCSLLGASKISKQDSETWPQTLFFSSSNSNTTFLWDGRKRPLFAVAPCGHCHFCSLSRHFISHFPLVVVEGLGKKLAKKSIKLHRKAHHTAAEQMSPDMSSQISYIYSSALNFKKGHLYCFSVISLSHFTFNLDMY